MPTSLDDSPLGLDPLLRQALDCAGQAVAIYTVAEWAIASTVIYASPALCELSGYEEEHFVGHSALLLAGARPDATTLASILPGVGARELEQRTRKQRPDGSTYEVDVRVVPLTDARGEVTHYLSLQRKVEPIQAARLLSVADTHAAAHQIAQPFVDGEVVVSVATWADALERLALAERFDLVVCDTRSPHCDEFRARARDSLPESTCRVFEISVAVPDESGVFPRDLEVDAASAE